MATIRGTARADTLHGTAGNDTLIGGLNDDRLFGYAGNDTLEGGDGRDRLLGGKGNDTLLGGAGNDQLQGDAGNDRIWGGGGADSMVGGAGSDRLYADDGNDFLFLSRYDKGWGGSGNDILYTTEGNVIAYGEAGNDRFSTDSATNVTYTGGEGADWYGFVGGPNEVTITDYVPGTDSMVYGRSSDNGEIMLDQIIAGFDVSGNGRLDAADGLSQTRAEDSYTFNTDADGNVYSLDLQLNDVNIHFANVDSFF